MPYAALPSQNPHLVDSRTGQISAHGSALTQTAHAYGDLARFGRELLCVREDGEGDELVAIDVESGDLRPLLATNGFIATPRVHEGRLAWVQWDNDVMPWDSAEVWVADYEPGRSVSGSRRIAGGPSESAIQPTWDAGGALYLLSDRTGWWNLYRWRDGHVEALAPMNAECATAPWESSYSNYVLLSNGRIGMTVQDGPQHRLTVVEPDGTLTPIEIPYQSIKPYLTAIGDQIALIGSSTTRAQEIGLVATDGSHHLTVVRSTSEPKQQPVHSVPEVMSVGSARTEIAALFYPPTSGGLPAPLIVRPHAGPTYNSELRLDMEVQFFTHRGFAVVDVDYRGSTGYGRSFRKALDGNWGRLDVEDCCNVARHLLSTGHALPGAVFISGASAGGYTALRAVCEDGPFAIAVARSAIVDPQRWTTTAPRFQRPHAAILSHDSAKVEPERLRRPALLIHGDADLVAPIDDILKLAAAIDERGLLAGMLKLRGIGHYLSEPDSLAVALEAELAAYQSVLGVSTS